MTRVKRTRANIMIVVTGTIILSIAAAWLGMDLLHRPAREFPAWWSASSTAAAFTAAAVAAMFAADAFRLEHRRDERWQTERRQAQASLVAAWPLNLVRVETRVGNAVPDTVQLVVARIINTSTLPVRNVYFEAFVTVASNGMSMRHRIGSHLVAVVPPGESSTEVRIPADDPARSFLQPGGASVDWIPDVRLSFTDAAGVRWMRDENGVLADISEESPVAGS